MKKKTIPADKFFKQMDRGGRAQDQVMVNYINKYGLKGRDQEYLHMFFSPSRVPKNLTEGEVRLVILMQGHWNCNYNCRQGGAVRMGFPQKMTRHAFLKMIGEVINKDMDFKFSVRPPDEK
ncbi:MAG: hypothetical protein WCO30_01865 [bacterium]